jgi:hypothetical protein
VSRVAERGSERYIFAPPMPTVGCGAGAVVGSRLLPGPPIIVDIVAFYLVSTGGRPPEEGVVMHASSISALRSFSGVPVGLFGVYGAVRERNFGAVAPVRG